MPRKSRLVWMVLVALVGSAIAVGTAVSATGVGASLARIDKVKIWLLSPDDGAAIPQNVSTIGCSPSTYGYGWRITFEWRANHRKDVAGYQLRFQHRGSILPILNITIPGAESSTYSVQQCHSFVADFNLTNWDWSVRAIDDQGQPGESTQGTFDFAPCRLDDGTPCHP